MKQTNRRRRFTPLKPYTPMKRVKHNYSVKPYAVYKPKPLKTKKPMAAKAVAHVRLFHRSPPKAPPKAPFTYKYKSKKEVDVGLVWLIITLIAAAVGLTFLLIYLL